MGLEGPSSVPAMYEENGLERDRKDAAGRRGEGDAANDSGGRGGAPVEEDGEVDRGCMEKDGAGAGPEAGTGAHVEERYGEGAGAEAYLPLSILVRLELFVEEEGAEWREGDCRRRAKAGGGGVDMKFCI